MCMCLGPEDGHFRYALRQAEQMLAVSVCCANRKPLVVRQHLRNHNRQVVSRESGSAGCIVVRASMERQYAKRAANLRLAEFGGFALSERTKFASAALHDVAGNVICKCGGFRAGARRIGKDVKVSEGALLDEAERGGVVFVGFARETSQDVRTDGSVGDEVTN